MNKFDHIVFCANTLDIGIEYIQDMLKVRVPKGGQHIKMGTHNAVMKFSDDCYFEIIAIDHDATAPSHPRWFNMDNANDRLAVTHRPRLITWVVNTGDLEQCRNQSVFPYPPGIEMSRKTQDGELNWSITVPNDGSLPAGGLLPTLIQWHHQGPHPAANMPDLGCKLTKLSLHHPNRSWLEQQLSAIHCLDMVELIKLPDNANPLIEAHIQTPNSTAILTS